MGSKPKFLFQLLALILTLALAGCNGAEEKIFFKNVGDPDLFESDVEGPAAQNTVDIEIRNSEELVVDTVQSNLFLQQYVPLFKYMDLNGLEGFAQGGGEYETPCSTSGVVKLSSGVDPGESYTAGDLINVEFADCVDGDFSYSGKIDYRYGGIESLNDKFTSIDTEHCVARAMSDFDVADSDVIYFSADSLKFEPFGEETRLQYIDFVPSDSSDVEVKEIKDTVIVTQKRPLILIKQPNETNIEALTSMEGGDAVYILENLTLNELNCQLYSREVEAKISNLVTVLPNLRLSLDGELTLYEASADLDSVTHAIRNSDFKLVVNEAAAERKFYFTSYSSEYIDSVSIDGYQFNFRGAVQSDAYQFLDADDIASGGSSIILNVISDLKGVDYNYPSSGELEMLGRGLERVTINADGSEVGIYIDWDGFERIKGRSQTDFSMNTDWTALFDRDFIFSDYLVEE